MTTTAPTNKSIPHRQRSTEEDRLAIVSNLPSDATELTLRHFLHGTMARHNLREAGSEPWITKIQFIASTNADVPDTLGSTGGDVASPSTTALVEFATSDACHQAIRMLGREDLTFQGSTIQIKKLTGSYHVDHADRGESLRHSINKRNAVTDTSDTVSAVKIPPQWDRQHLRKEIARLEDDLARERVTLNRTRDELLEEQSRQVTSDNMMASTTAAVLSRTRDALAQEQEHRTKLEQKLAYTESLLSQAYQEIERLSMNHMRKDPDPAGEEMMDQDDDDDEGPVPTEDGNPLPLDKIHPGALEKVFNTAEHPEQ